MTRNLYAVALPRDFGIAAGNSALGDHLAGRSASWMMRQRTLLTDPTS